MHPSTICPSPCFSIQSYILPGLTIHSRAAEPDGKDRIAFLLVPMFDTSDALDGLGTCHRLLKLYIHRIAFTAMAAILFFPDADLGWLNECLVVVD